MLFTPILAFHISYFAVLDTLFFPDRLVALPLERYNWSFSSDQAYQISHGLLLILSFLPVIGLKAAFSCIAEAAVCFALWLIRPAYFEYKKRLYGTFVVARSTTCRLSRRHVS